MKKPPRSKKHGGARKGAGRPETGRKRFVTNLSGLNVDYLKHFAKEKGMSTAAYLDLLIAKAWEAGYQELTMDHFEDPTETVEEICAELRLKYEI